MMTRHDIDTWVLRAKDLAIVIGIIVSIWGWGIKLTELPIIVDAQAKEIVQLKDTALSNQKRLERLETALTYIAGDIKDIKSAIKDTNDLVRRHMETSQK